MERSLPTIREPLSGYTNIIEGRWYLSDNEDILSNGAMEGENIQADGTTTAINSNTVTSFQTLSPASLPASVAIPSGSVSVMIAPPPVVAEVSTTTTQTPVVTSTVEIASSTTTQLLRQWPHRPNLPHLRVESYLINRMTAPFLTQVGTTTIGSISEMDFQECCIPSFLKEG